MKIIQPEILINSNELVREKLTQIERYARTCYKSTVGLEYNPSFLKDIIENGHESVIEHEKVTVIFVIDRGISNQIIRHRIASYSQESTRYCNYSLDKFGNEITVIEPFFYPSGSDGYYLWEKSCKQSEENYMALCAISTSEEARSVLPNSLKTELVTTYNFREWRHFFSLRCSTKSHPQMRQVAIPLLIKFKAVFSPIYDDIEYDKEFPAEAYAKIVVR